MLANLEFEEWCNQVEISAIAREVVEQIRASEPVRLVGGGNNNVCGRYPSFKMGKTIQFESHKVELPAIEKYEADDEVLEYYDQPIKLNLSYTNIKGRAIHSPHVPDFLILRKNEVGFEEWKSEQQLIKLAEKQPNHFQKDANGKWHNPPAEAEAAKFGLFYKLRLDTEINWIEYRNNRFLKSYRDGGV